MVDEVVVGGEGLAAGVSGGIPKVISSNILKRKKCKSMLLLIIVSKGII